MENLREDALIEEGLQIKDYSFIDNYLDEENWFKEMNEHQVTFNGDHVDMRGSHDEEIKEAIIQGKGWEAWSFDASEEEYWKAWYYDYLANVEYSDTRTAPDHKH